MSHRVVLLSRYELDVQIDIIIDVSYPLINASWACHLGLKTSLVEKLEQWMLDDIHEPVAVENHSILRIIVPYSSGT